MAKLIKEYTDYGVTVRIIKQDNGRYAITNNCGEDEDGYFLYEKDIHPDHFDDLEHIATYHCEEMAALIAQAQEEFGI